jgi:hypothetical protein
MSIQPSPKESMIQHSPKESVISSARDPEEDYSPIASTPNDRVLVVTSILSDYGEQTRKKSHLDIRQISSIAEQHKNNFIEKQI